MPLPPALRSHTAHLLVERFQISEQQAHLIFDKVHEQMDEALRYQLQHPEGRNAFWTAFYRYQRAAQPDRPVTCAAEDVRAMGLVDHLLGKDAPLLVQQIRTMCKLDEMVALGVVFFTAPIFIACLKQRMEEVGVTRAMLPFLMAAPGQEMASSTDLPRQIWWPFGNMGPFHC